jgi:hypothetical protein
MKNSRVGTQYRIYVPLMCGSVVVGGIVVNVLATGPKVCGFKLGRGRWIFKGDKNMQHVFLRKGNRAVSPSS